MKRSIREAAKQSAETRRKAQAANAAARLNQEQIKAEAVRQALAKPLRTRASLNQDDIPIIQVVSEQAPRLLDSKAYADALRHAAALPEQRPLKEWVPRGKGRETLFRSLMEHLFALFPTPAFLWSVFFEEDAGRLGPVAAHIAKGESLYEAVKKGVLPVPLTRKMCHDFMQTPSDVTFLHAIRRVQIRACNGSPRFFQAWLATAAGRRVQRAEEEAFWVTVLDWMGKNPMLDPTQIGPIVDFIANRRARDASFSMKGRTVLALLRSVNEWHGDLAKKDLKTNTIFQPSGFKEAEFDHSRRENGNHINEVWRMREILTAKDLLDEGRRMKHCVFSYASNIERGGTSIWSLTMEDGLGETGNWSMATIEVQNGPRCIVQAKGRFNRVLTAREHQMLTRWANLNNLQVKVGAW